MALETQNRGLTVQVRDGDSPAIIQLLEETVLGTPGKLRYRRLGTAKQMRSHDQIEFIQIMKRDRVLGTAGVITRSPEESDQDLTAFYVRYLSVRNPFDKKNKTSKKPSGSRRRGSSALRDRIASVITSHFEKLYHEQDQKAAFYAYVEAENENSRALCMSLGFMPEREVNTLLFSRFFPKTRAYISSHQPQDEAVIQQGLRKYYSDHSFYTEDDLFGRGQYLVARKNGRITAGLRAVPVEWEIIDMPGWKGMLMQHILPYLPLTGRLFEPGRFRFLSFDHCWHHKGEEAEISRLMEHALASSGHHTGMCWMDARSHLCTHLKENAQLGILHRLNGVVRADLMVRLVNFSGQQASELLRKPVFVSAPDMT